MRKGEIEKRVEKLEQDLQSGAVTGATIIYDADVPGDAERLHQEALQMIAERGLDRARVSEPRLILIPDNHRPHPGGQRITLH